MTPEEELQSLGGRIVTTSAPNDELASLGGQIIGTRPNAIDEAANNPDFNPHSHAAQYVLQDEEHPEVVFAHNVLQRRKELGLPGETQPSTWETIKEAPATIGKFALGIPAAAALHGQALGLEGAKLGFDLLDYATGSGPGQKNPNSWRPSWLDPAYEHAKNLAQISEGKALEPARQLAKEGKVFGIPVLPAGYALPNEDEKSLYKFTQAAKSAAIQQQLAQGTVPEQSALGTIGGAINLDLPKNEPMSPWEQTVVDASSMTTDPVNLGITVLPLAPGAAQISKTIGGGIEGASNAALSAIKSPVGKIVAGTGGAAGLGALGWEAYHNPERAAEHAAEGIGVAGLLLAAKYGGGAIKQAGQMGLGEAIPETVGPLGTMARQGILGTVGGAETGAIMGAANLANNGADNTRDAISKITQPMAQMSSLGAMAGFLHSPKDAMVQNANLNAQKQGRLMAQAELQTSPYAQQSTGIISQLPPAVQNEIYQWKGQLQSKSPVELHVVDGPTFQAATGGGGTERGVYRENANVAPSADGRAILLNADAISNKGAGILQPLRHEIGHAITTLDIADSVKNALTPEELQQAKEQYATALLGRKPTPDEVNGVDVEGETIAEITRNILNGTNAGQFSLPKPISQKIGDAVSRTLENSSWLPDWMKPGKTGEDLGFGTKNVKETARQIQDALYQKGEEARDLRIQQAKGKGNADQRINQINARLSEIAATPRANVTPEILGERQKLISERNNLTTGLEENQNPKPLSQATLQPVAPLAPSPAATSTTAPAFDRTIVSKALQDMFKMNKRTADQFAALAKGNNVNEAVAHALSLAQQSRSNPPPVAPVAPLAQGVPTNPVSTAPLASVTPAVETKPQNVPVPVQTLETGTSPEGVATNPAQRLSDNPQDKGAADVAQVPAPETVDHQQRIQDALAQAEQAAQGPMAKAKGGKNKPKEARQAEILRQHRTNALAGLLEPNNEGLLQPVTDPETGEVKLKGNINPENPIHDAILSEFGYTPEQKQQLLDAQNRQGEGVWLRDYNSAKQEGFETGEGLDFSGEKRNEEYSKSTAAERLAGKGETSKQDKPVTILGTQLTGKGPVINTFDHDKFLNNVREISAEAEKQGIQLPIHDLKGGARDTYLSKAFQNYSENHANGWKGDGSAPLDVFPDSGITVNPDYVGKPVDKATADMLNLAMHNEQAKSPEAPNGKTELAQKKFAKAQDFAKQAQGLNRANQGFINEEGETNPLRAQLTEKGWEPEKILKPVFSTVQPNLIEGGIHDTPTHGKSVHAHGFDIPPQELTAQGFPQQKQTAAGFMPEENTHVSNFMPEDNQEKIKGTAVLLRDGTILRGPNANTIHASILDQVPQHAEVADGHGFVTDTGRFVGRDEATQIAQARIRSLGAEHLTKAGNLSQKNIQLQREFDQKEADDIRAGLERAGWSKEQINEHLQRYGYPTESKGSTNFMPENQEDLDKISQTLPRINEWDNLRKESMKKMMGSEEENSPRWQWFKQEAEGPAHPNPAQQWADSVVHEFGDEKDIQKLKPDDLYNLGLMPEAAVTLTKAEESKLEYLIDSDEDRTPEDLSELNGLMRKVKSGLIKGYKAADFMPEASFQKLADRNNWTYNGKIEHKGVTLRLFTDNDPKSPMYQGTFVVDGKNPNLKDVIDRHAYKLQQFIKGENDWMPEDQQAKEAGLPVKQPLARFILPAAPLSGLGQDKLRGDRLQPLAR